MRFLNAATAYLTRRQIVAGNHVFDIVEIEFYKYSKNHPDPFTHCHPQQQTRGQWYFHRGSRKPDAKYKGGTFKGLDFTFSDGKSYAGVIIRSLRDQSGKTIEGPCKCVDTILACCGVKHITELVEQISLNINAKDLLYMRKKKPPLSYTILAGPRIGLRKGKSEDHDKYVDRPYRFVLEDTGVKKQKKSLKQV